MSLTYSTFVTALETETEIPASDPNLAAQIPVIIDDAEQRVYRELDLLASIVTVSSSLTVNSRTFTLPTTSGGGTIHFLVVDSFNVFDSSSVRHPVRVATREWVDSIYPSEAAPYTPSFPKEFCRADDLTLRIGPAPDSTYACEVIGTIRPAPLSVSNTSTYLSQYLPDLFFAASMVRACAYMQNFGAMADNPQMAVAWEAHYQALKASAVDEELRKSYVSRMSAPPVSQRDA